MRSKVTSKKLTIFLLVSIVILRPCDLNTLLTSCLVFSISLGVALHTAMPSSRIAPVRYIAPVNQLSAVKNEFSSEGLRVFDQEHPAGKQKHVPPKTDREDRITNSTYALEGLFLSQPPD